MKHKSCLSCGVLLPATLEFFNSAGRGRLTSKCTPCDRLYRKSGAIGERRRASGRRRLSSMTAEQKADRAANHKQYMKKWEEKNKNRYAEKRKTIQRNYQSRRRNDDVAFRITQNMKRMLRYNLLSKRGMRAEQILGYSMSDLRRHLERQFIAGMNWENYGKGGWHIDHITPISSFREAHLTGTADFRACWSLTNLRPLWERDNLIKGKKRLFIL